MLRLGDQYLQWGVSQIGKPSWSRSTVISLSEELDKLRNNICHDCKRKLIPDSALSTGLNASHLLLLQCHSCRGMFTASIRQCRPIQPRKFQYQSDLPAMANKRAGSEETGVICAKSLRVVPAMTKRRRSRRRPVGTTYTAILMALSSESQRRLYTLEKADNFRWVAKIFSRLSTYILTSVNLASLDLQHELSEIGQFAELSHGKLSPEFIWRNMDRLLQASFPLVGYDALRESELVSVFHGTASNLQGYISRRSNQLIISFSGTSNFQQTIANIDARLVAFPKDGCAIHAGFWRLYNGLRTNAFSALAEALLHLHDVHEIVFTGHSLGAVMCYLMALEAMEGHLSRDASPTCMVLTIAVFGCPRVGNFALVRHWRDVVDDYISHGFTVNEYSIKGFNDGVPSIPPQWLGYYHFAQSPLYFVEGCLYHIPPSESEMGRFRVQAEVAENAQGRVLQHPLGGHNYYNNRDMERVLRTMVLLCSTSSGEPDWDGYLDRLHESGESY